MEIWSSPAAYDELNGNAEPGGGGADPIARELEEGEGGPVRSGDARGGPGSAAAAGPGSAERSWGWSGAGRGNGGSRSLPGWVLSPFPFVCSLLPAAGWRSSIPGELLPGPVEAPWVTLTPGRVVTTPVGWGKGCPLGLHVPMGSALPWDADP